MTWKPAVYKEGTFLPLLRPVVSLAIKDSWDMRDAKVPLADRSHVNGVSKNGVTITVSGGAVIDGETNANFCTEAESLAAYLEMRSVLDVSDDSQRFEFFIYHDEDSAYCRKFKSCVCKELSVDLGDEARLDFPYSLVVFAEDPVMHTTAPGA